MFIPLCGVFTPFFFPSAAISPIYALPEYFAIMAPCQEQQRKRIFLQKSVSHNIYLNRELQNTVLAFAATQSSHRHIIAAFSIFKLRGGKEFTSTKYPLRRLHLGLSLLLSATHGVTGGSKAKIGDSSEGFDHKSHGGVARNYSREWSGNKLGKRRGSRMWGQGHVPTKLSPVGAKPSSNPVLSWWENSRSCSFSLKEGSQSCLHQAFPAGRAGSV